MAMVTSTIGYSLMLVAMTFNVYLFISVILGFGIGTLCCGHWTEPARSHGSEPLAAHTASEVASSRWSDMQPPLLAVKGASHLLRVDGMTCDGCVTKVERTLAAVDGVETVRVNLAAGLARVTGTVGASELVAAVQATGRVASIVEGAADDTRDLEQTCFCGPS